MESSNALFLASQSFSTSISFCQGYRVCLIWSMLFANKALQEQGQQSSLLSVGNLHFVKFETSKIDQCLDFIKSKNLHHCPDDGNGKKPQMRVQATGGGAFKYADMFQVGRTLHCNCAHPL